MQHKEDVPENISMKHFLRVMWKNKSALSCFVGLSKFTSNFSYIRIAPNNANKVLSNKSTVLEFQLFSITKTHVLDVFNKSLFQKRLNWFIIDLSHDISC